jgi:hypothetical protein
MEPASLRGPGRHALLSAAAAGLPVVVVGLLVWPMASTDLSFPSDWMHHLWLVEHAAESLRLRHHPSLYTNDSDNVLYPNFAFYGATSYSLVGALALVLGSARSAYVAVYALAMLMAYGGWYWLGRMAGLGRWTAQLPAVVAVTAPFLLGMMYERGAWAEFFAVSSISLLVASAVSVLRADRLRAAPAAALAASVLAFSGTHNLTVVWGGTMLAIAAVALGVAVPPIRHLVTRRGLLRVLGIAIPALLVNAWFLIPDLAYQSQTMIVAWLPSWRALLHTTSGLVEPSALFQVFGDGTVPGDGNPAKFHTALPVLAMGWCVVAAVLVMTQWRRSAAVRALLVLCAVAAAFWILMTDPERILLLPRPYIYLQFSFRIESEVLLAVVGATLAGLVALRAADGRASRWAWVLVPVAAVSLVAAVVQVGGAPREQTKRPFYALQTSGPHNADYSSSRIPLIARANVPALQFSAAEADASGRVTASVAAEPGGYVRSNLSASPELIDIDGARIVGNGLEYGALLQIDADATPGVQQITASESHPWPVRLGQVLSLLGLLGLAANAAVVARRSLRRRRAIPAS